MSRICGLLLGRNKSLMSFSKLAKSSFSSWPPAAALALLLAYVIWLRWHEEGNNRQHSPCDVEILAVRCRLLRKCDEVLQLCSRYRDKCSNEDSCLDSNIVFVWAALNFVGNYGISFKFNTEFEILNYFHNYRYITSQACLPEKERKYRWNTKVLLILNILPTKYVCMYPSSIRAKIKFWKHKINCYILQVLVWKSCTVTSLRAR